MRRPDLNGLAIVVAEIPATVGPVFRRYVVNGQCYAAMKVLPPHSEPVQVYRGRAA